jgi:hypothetical protein
MHDPEGHEAYQGSVQVFHLDQRVFSLPNEAAARRLTLFLAESWANTESVFLEGFTPWEHALLRGVEETLERVQELPPVDPSLLRQELEPRRFSGRYVEAYGRSGGLLNLFNPWATEADDDQWAEMQAGIAHLEGRALAEAEIEIARLWNETAHDLFSGLTPAQVWAGGGPRERALAVQALEWVEEAVARESHLTPGEALNAHLKALRLWQLRPQRQLKKRSPHQVILAERESILARREEFLQRLDEERKKYG